MTNLITISDIQAFKPISNNIDVSKKLNTFIREAQEFDLRPILGDEFYLAIVADFEASPSLVTYSDLFNGVTYTYGSNTYQHDGLKSVLVYYAYSRYLNDVQINQTAYGAVTKTNPDSQPISEKALARQVGQAVSGARAYEQRVIEYLKRNEATYPLWKCYEKSKKTGGFRVSSIR